MAVVRVDGLACPFCAYGLEKKLKKLEGVASIEINIEEATVELTLQPEAEVTEEAIREKVKAAGFTPKEIAFREPENKKKEKDGQTP